MLTFSLYMTTEEACKFASVPVDLYRLYSAERNLKTPLSLQVLPVSVTTKNGCFKDVQTNRNE